MYIHTYVASFSIIPVGDLLPPGLKEDTVNMYTYMYMYKYAGIADYICTIL